MLYAATVLMATYNGEKFLDQQLESLSLQVGVKLSIYALDAGSTDQTISILQKWIDKGLSLSYQISEGSNPSNTFMTLLRQRKGDDFIFFADQDDLWNQDKCLTMIEKHLETKSDVIICQRLIIDEQGNAKAGQTSKKLIPSWNNALVENIAYGNCTLITSKFAKFISTTSPPDDFLYDSWIYLLASLQKSISGVNSIQVSYRIHSGNAIGVSGKIELLRKYRAWSRFSNQVLFIKAMHLNELTESEKRFFLAYRDCFEKFSLLKLVKVTLRNPALRQNLFESTLFRLVFPIVVILFWIN